MLILDTMKKIYREKICALQLYREQMKKCELRVSHFLHSYLGVKGWINIQPEH